MVRNKQTSIWLSQCGLMSLTLVKCYKGLISERQTDLRAHEPRYHNSVLDWQHGSLESAEMWSVKVDEWKTNGLRHRQTNPRNTPRSLQLEVNIVIQRELTEKGEVSSVSNSSLRVGEFDPPKPNTVEWDVEGPKNDFGAADTVGIWATVYCAIKDMTYSKGCPLASWALPLNHRAHFPQDVRRSLHCEGS